MDKVVEIHHFVTLSIILAKKHPVGQKYVFNAHEWLGVIEKQNV